MKAPRVKTLNKNSYWVEKINQFPNFSATGSIKGMRNLYYGNKALLVRYKGYIYNVSSEPVIYNCESY